MGNKDGHMPFLRKKPGKTQVFILTSYPVVFLPDRPPSGEGQPF